MNPFKTIGHGIKAGAVDVAKGAVAVADFAVIHPVEFLLKADKVLAEAIKDEPAVQAAVLQLVKEATTVIGDGSTVVAGKGLNLSNDSKALADAEAFFNYFKGTFMPLIVKAYHDGVTAAKS